MTTTSAPEAQAWLARETTPLGPFVVRLDNYRIVGAIGSGHWAVVVNEAGTLKRVGRIFVDYLRNGRGATAVAPWSSRAKPNGTVAVPVTFEMVRDGVGPGDFAIGSKALDKALARPDPWADFFKAAKPLKL